MKKIVLASSSPRRKDILSKNNINFIVKIPTFDEQNIKIKNPIKLTKALSIGKANSIDIEDDEIIISCDTIVYFKRKIIGKPKNENDAINILKSLSGKKHYVFSAVCVKSNKKTKVFCEKTAVYFNDLSDEKIINYVKSGEPMDKAGAYAIQSKKLDIVKKIKGDYDNVVGLPFKKLLYILKKDFKYT